MFLNPARVGVNEKGPFILTEEDECLYLPALFSDLSGCYSVCLDKEELAAVYPVISCKNCGKRFSPTIFNKGVCPHFGTQN